MTRPDAGTLPAGGRPSVLVNIQALRAFAALLVIFVHLKLMAVQAGFAATAMDFGNAGVDVFFVISGVIMVFSTERRETTAGNFLLHRFVRIAPFYWLMTFLMFAIALAAPQLMQSTRADLPDLVRSLAFVPYQKANGLIEPIVFVGWSLNYEMAFYLLFGLTLLIRPRGLGLGTCLAALVGVAGYGFLAQPRNPIVGFYTYAIILEFGAGIAIGWAMLRLQRPRAAGRGAWGTMAVAALAALALIGGYFVLPEVDRVVISGVPAVVLVVAALRLEQHGLRLTWPLAKRLGDASYAIYLTHFFVTQAVTRAAARLPFSNPLIFAGLVVVCMGLSCVVGLIVHDRVEAPLTRWVSRLLGLSRARDRRKAPGPSLSTALGGATPPPS
jgi:peptidoglycan/LPS O-acetylase OafA/YrhL